MPTKKRVVNKVSPKIVKSEVVKTPPNAPTDNTVVSSQSTPGGGSNNILKIGCGLCLGCLLLIIIVIALIIFSGGMFLKNIGIPFLKDVGRKVETDIKNEENLKKFETGTDLLKNIPSIAGQDFKAEDGKIPAGFPSDFPIYPGASIDKSVSGNTMGVNSYLVNIETIDGTERVINYYKSALPQSDWEITKEFGDTKSMFFTVKKGSDSGLVTISYSEEKGKTVVSVVLGGR